MKVDIPRLQQFLPMLLNNAGDAAHRFGAETARVGALHRIEPELRQMLTRLDMDMGWLVPSFE